MDYLTAIKLVDILRLTAPVDTGQLKQSIQLVQLDANTWVVIIGNDTAAQRKVPSSEYAYYTNYHNKSSYHWVNNAINKWISENAIQIGYNINKELIE